MNTDKHSESEMIAQSTTVSMAAHVRDIRQETLSAAVYLNYFQKTHDEN